MTTETRLIHPEKTQILQRPAHAVRGRAQTTDTFAEVLDTESARIEPTTDQPDAGAADQERGPESEPVKTDHPEDGRVEGETEEPVLDPESTDESESTDHPDVPDDGVTLNPDAESTPASDAPIVNPENIQSNPEPAGQPIDMHQEEPGLVALSQSAERSKFQIQGIARELTHAASVDVARVANEELGAQTNREIANNDGQGVFKDSLIAGEPQSAPATNSTNQAQTNRAHPRSSPDHVPTNPNEKPVVDSRIETQPRPDSQTLTHTNTIASTNVAQSAAATLMPDAIRSVLDRVNQVRALIPGAPVSVSAGAPARPGAVTAVAGTGQNSVGADATKHSKLGQIREPSSSSSTDRNSVISQVQKGLASILKSGGGSMIMKLRPDHLGEVRIKVDTEGGAIRARFETETQGARDSIENGFSKLKEHLESKGVRVEELRVDQRADDQSGLGEHGTDRETGSGNQDQNKDPARYRTTHAQDDEQSEQSPEGIWTDLGLDAIA